MTKWKRCYNVKSSSCFFLERFLFTRRLTSKIGQSVFLTRVIFVNNTELLRTAIRTVHPAALNTVAIGTDKIPRGTSMNWAQQWAYKEIMDILREHGAVETNDEESVGGAMYFCMWLHLAKVPLKQIKGLIEREEMNYAKTTDAEIVAIEDYHINRSTHKQEPYIKPPVTDCTPCWK
jgi:hypothetical protein